MVHHSTTALSLASDAWGSLLGHLGGLGLLLFRGRRLRHLLLGLLGLLGFLGDPGRAEGNVAVSKSFLARWRRQFNVMSHFERADPQSDL